MLTQPQQQPPFLIGHNIRLWRQLKSIKQESLAKALGVHKSCISNIENNKMDLCLSRIEKIAVFLGLAPQQLFTNPEEEIAPRQKSLAHSGNASMFFPDNLLSAQ